MTKKEEFERTIGVGRIFDAFVTSAGADKADFQKLAQSIDGVEILSEFYYRFAEIAEPDRQRPYLNDAYEPTAYQCAKKVLAEAGVMLPEETGDRGHSVQLNLDALKAVMLKVLEWSGDDAQAYHRFMNKVKYDVLARYPEQLKTRRGG